MITVTTAWEDIDEFPDAGDVSIMMNGALIVTRTLTEEEDINNVPPLAIYAPGAWQRVERDESATQLMSFLTDHNLRGEWAKYREGETE